MTRFGHQLRPDSSSPGARCNTPGSVAAASPPRLTGFAHQRPKRGGAVHYRTGGQPSRQLAVSARRRADRPSESAGATAGHPAAPAGRWPSRPVRTTSSPIAPPIPSVRGVVQRRSSPPRHRAARRSCPPATAAGPGRDSMAATRHLEHPAMPSGPAEVSGRWKFRSKSGSVSPRGGHGGGSSARQRDGWHRPGQQGRSGADDGIPVRRLLGHHQGDDGRPQPRVGFHRPGERIELRMNLRLPSISAIDTTRRVTIWPRSPLGSQNARPQSLLPGSDSKVQLS